MEGNVRTALEIRSLEIELVLVRFAQMELQLLII